MLQLLPQVRARQAIKIQNCKKNIFLTKFSFLDDLLGSRKKRTVEEGRVTDITIVNGYKRILN